MELLGYDLQDHFRFRQNIAEGAWELEVAVVGVVELPHVVVVVQPH